MVIPARINKAKQKKKKKKKKKPPKRARQAALRERHTLSASLVVHSKLDHIAILEQRRLGLDSRGRQSSVVEERARR
jgi:hypothetical protein